LVDHFVAPRFCRIKSNPTSSEKKLPQLFDLI
jgi:hypothetical protein